MLAVLKTYSYPRLSRFGRDAINEVASARRDSTVHAPELAARVASRRGARPIWVGRVDVGGRIGMGILPHQTLPNTSHIDTLPHPTATIRRPSYALIFHP